jgi:hypothetical protein
MMKIVGYEESVLISICYWRSINLIRLNPAASAFPVACCGVSERMGNNIVPYGLKLSAVYCGELQF